MPRLGVLAAAGVAVVAAVIAVLLVTGDDGPDAQFAPSLPSAAGYRADDADLLVWTGSPCRGITRVRVTYDAGTSDSVSLVLEAPEPGVRLERLNLTDPGSAFTEVETPPASFDWRDAETVSVGLDGGEARWSSVGDVDEIMTGSTEHPVDTYLFDDLGWLDPAEAVAQDGRT